MTAPSPSTPKAPAADAKSPAPAEPGKKRKKKKAAAEEDDQFESIISLFVGDAFDSDKDSKRGAKYSGQLNKTNCISFLEQMCKMFNSTSKDGTKVGMVIPPELKSGADKLMAGKMPDKKDIKAFTDTAAKAMMPDSKAGQAMLSKGMRAGISILKFLIKIPGGKKLAGKAIGSAMEGMGMGKGGGGGENSFSFDADKMQFKTKGKSFGLMEILAAFLKMLLGCGMKMSITSKSPATTESWRQLMGDSPGITFGEIAPKAAAPASKKEAAQPVLGLEEKEEKTAKHGLGRRP